MTNQKLVFRHSLVNEPHLTLCNPLIFKDIFKFQAINRFIIQSYNMQGNSLVNSTAKVNNLTFSLDYLKAG